VLVAWETIDVADQPSHIRDFATIWRAADKVVYSTTLSSTSSARTRIERTFDADAIRAMKASTERDLSIGGADLAGQALAAGLIDECHLFLSPVVVGEGAPALPTNQLVDLELLDERRFTNGTVRLRYRVDAATG
jgi:dihydrofolate reductase